MTLIRPELRMHLRRWREAFVGFLVIALGARWSFGLSGGMLHWLGFSLLFLGGSMFWLGVRRARLFQKGDGLGVVDVTERLITYMGPEGGGSLSIESLVYVAIHTEMDMTDTDCVANIDLKNSNAVWKLRGDDGQLSVPVNACGADALFDALTVLPNVDFSAALDAMSATAPNTFVIWRASFVLDRPSPHH